MTDDLDAATFVIRLRASRRRDDAVHAIRWILKLALRKFDLRCISVQEEHPRHSPEKGTP